MNYANMIEEKNLKKTFIIATLCSTLVGTFTSSMGLWDRVNEKRNQQKRDYKQDSEIKKLREQVEQAEKRSKERDDELQRRKLRDDVGDSFERSGALIRREFDDGYERLGRRFAVGDTVTENRLQAQIISLQQTVIQVLQDALYNDRQLTRADINRLITASQSAREGSLDALRQQYQRMAIDAPPQRALPPPKRASTIIEAEPLFCRYSLDLQYIPNKPLATDFAPGGGCRCPACGVRLAAESDDFWQIGKRTPIIIAEGGYEKEVFEEREFHLGQRFVIKCHTVDGEYACVLCNKNRDVDAICRTVESLVNHVGRFHDITELEQEVDLRERPMPLALPPAPAPPQPSSLRDREIKEVEIRENSRRLPMPEYR
ncbi:hypothetical protein K469DRAFT_681842 [Zopfia rhizophila CBS 207.26]|uniref:Uncharacterized protein n=1 Tax=Zopfia rhizophila CBS 207.26 TaxID=1314779 RepID=A0A6A6ETS1_9PEZI|nr:hypothetical protein K469DRAFT_681842 [Zopfia rhizophila CBS 207.26]